MTIETARGALHQKLNEVLGFDHASTLMTYLPTGEPASKADVADVKSALNELRAEIGGMRSSVKSDISDLRSEIGGLRSSVKADISELRTEIKSDLHQMESRLGARIDGVETRLNNHEVRFDNVHEALRQQTRTFILATTGSMVALSGIAFGAAALI